jgi:MFS family permease
MPDAASAGAGRAKTRMPGLRVGVARPQRGVAAAVIGNALEFYDFTVYAAFAPMLARAFFPTKDPVVGLLLAASTFGIGFVVRPLGGMIFGAYSDHRGRRAAMSLTIWLMALGSGMVGLLPTYAEAGMAAPALLVLARLIQGFSVGGEFAPSTVFLIESAPRGKECAFASWQFASQSMGNVVSGLVGILLAVLLPRTALDGWGWRIPFILGIAIAPVGFYLRRQVSETLDRGTAHNSMSAVLSDLLRNDSGLILLTVLAVSGLTVSSYFFLYATAYAATMLHYAPGMAMALSLTIGLLGAIFTPIGGLLADRYGTRPMALAPRLLLTLLMFPALSLALSSASPTIFLATIAGLMILHALSITAPLILFLKMFRARVRAAGLSIAAALGISLLGGTAQIVFTWIIGVTGDRLSFVWYVVGMNALTIVATLAILGYAARRQPRLGQP